MSDYAGEFLWYELMSTDPAGSEDFYKEVAGWTTEGWGEGPAAYTMWKAGDTTIGGVRQLPAEAQQGGAPSHWLAYVGTTDIGASFQKMQSLDGKVHVPPMEIPGVGKIAVFADPFGAVIAMYQPAGDAPSHGVQGPGRFSWHELYTTDLAGGIQFYETLFGWNKTSEMDMGSEHGIYHLYGKGDRNMGGMMKKPEVMPGPSAWLYYISVKDIRATLEVVTAKGGIVLNGPMEVPGGDLVAQCMDPQGAAFALHQSGAGA